MIKLKDARVTNAVPSALAAQPWVQALAYAEWRMRCLAMQCAMDSQIYTALDTCPQAVLDTLAVNWKVGWYDTDYPIQTKRRLIKTALQVRRTAGTLTAVKTQIDAIYPNSTVSEWWEYGGAPGTFRVRVDVTDTGTPEELFTVAQIEAMLYDAKRLSAHLDSVEFFTKPSSTARLHAGAACSAVYSRMNVPVKIYGLEEVM